MVWLYHRRWLGGWQEKQARSAAFMERAGATVAVVDRADTAMCVSTSCLRVPSYDVSGPSIHGWSLPNEAAHLVAATVRARGVLECHLPVALAVLHEEWTGRGCASE